MLHNLLAKAINNQADSFLFADTALQAVKQLFVADFAGGR